MWDIAIVLVVVGIFALVATVGRLNGADDDTEIGLGEDAGVPAADDLLAWHGRWPRPDAGARDRASYAALRLRLRERRLERDRLRPFLSGPPSEDDALDLDAITTAADRLKASTNRCA